MAIFGPTPGFKGRTFVSSGFSAEGDLNFCVRSVPLRVTGKVEIRTRKKLLAVGEAYKAIF